MKSPAIIRREALERQQPRSSSTALMCPDCGELIDARRTAEDLEALGGYAPTKDGEAKPGSLGWHSCTAGRRASMAQTSYDWRTHGR